MKRNHDDIGNFSLDKTLARVKEMYWFPRARRYVKGYIGACLYNKRPAGKKPGVLHSIDKVGQSFHTIHIDHLGPFFKSKKQNAYLIVLVDGFTKYTLLKAVRDTKSASVIRFLEEVVATYGAPTRIISDQGTAFTSKQFKNFSERHNIQHVLNSTVTPRANGQVERCNRSITPALANMSQDPEGRDCDEPQSQWGINNTIHKVTKRTRFSLLFVYTTRHVIGTQSRTTPSNYK